MKKFKKITATILAIALLASVAVITVSADRIPDDDYYTYIYNEADLKAACENGGVYKLVNDIETDENLYIDGEAGYCEGMFNLSLCGKTITFTGEGHLFTVSERSVLHLYDITFNKSNKNTDYFIFDSYINNEGNTICSNVNFYNGETVVDNTGYVEIEDCKFEGNITAIYNDVSGIAKISSSKLYKNDRGIMNFASATSSSNNFDTNGLAVYNLGAFSSTEDLFYNNNTAVFNTTLLNSEGEFENKNANITIDGSVFNMNHIAINNCAKASVKKAEITYNEIGVEGLTKADLKDSTVKLNLVNISGAMSAFLETLHSTFVSIIWKLKGIA